MIFLLSYVREGDNHIFKIIFMIMSISRALNEKQRDVIMKPTCQECNLGII